MSLRYRQDSTLLPFPFTGLVKVWYDRDRFFFRILKLLVLLTILKVDTSKFIPYKFFEVNKVINFTY